VSQEAVDVIRRANVAFNARDYDAMWELFDPDAEFVDHMPLPDVAHEVQGHDELRVLLDSWTEGFSGFEAHVDEYVDRGEFVVCETRWRFVSRDAGVELEWKGAEAWQVRNGRVVWGQVGFADRTAAENAVGRRARETA
jgi:ketosteroid isomerase-like protein